MNNIQPEDVHADIKALVATIETLPPEVQLALASDMVQVNNTLNRKRRILKLVQDALSQLRLDMKYLMFDLEATRRERDKLMEESGK
jgi:hypothetical protein